MNTTSSRMAEFLESFERSRAEGAEAAGTLYAETFLAAGPEGARCIRAEDFLKALPKRKEMFERAGCKRTELADVTETPLDERYAMARTKWRMTFVREDGGEDRRGGVDIHCGPGRRDAADCGLPVAPGSPEGAADAHGMKCSRHPSHASGGRLHPTWKLADAIRFPRMCRESRRIRNPKSNWDRRRQRPAGRR